MGADATFRGRKRIGDEFRPEKLQQFVCNLLRFRRDGEMVEDLQAADIDACIGGRIVFTDAEESGL